MRFIFLCFSREERRWGRKVCCDGERGKIPEKWKIHSSRLAATGVQQFKILICCDLIFGSIYVHLKGEREGAHQPYGDLKFRRLMRSSSNAHKYVYNECHLGSVFVGFGFFCVSAVYYINAVHTFKVSLSTRMLGKFIYINLIWAY